jgi:hypothetical protein
MSQEETHMAEHKRRATDKRDLDSTSYGATEREQTRDLERIHRKQDESSEFITDAEMEKREANGEP